MNSEVATYFPQAQSNPTGVDVPAPAFLPADLSRREASVKSTGVESPLNERSDEDLLLQVGEGGREALSILFQRHARSVFNVARRILKDNSEADDLLQELFLFVFQKARLFDARKGAAASWIIQTVAS